MIRGIRKTTSLRNLFTASCSGQIATLLTLSMVIVLMVIVATIKVGNVSNKVTAISNAADSSALLLASQLSTKAYQLWDSLDDDPNDGKGAIEKCQKSSFLSLLLGAIFAIICIVVIIFTFGAGAPLAFMATHMITIMVSAAVAGAVGGMVGAAISGTNVLQGAAQGAAVGAAIGGIAVGAAGVGGYVTVPLAGGGSALMATSVMASIGLIGTGVMGLGSAIYKAMSEASALDKSLSEAARALNGLPEKDTYREQVFLNALSQTIEDQNTTKTMGICKTEEKTNDEGETYTEYTKCDPHDADNDGDEDEVISYFSYWWDRRIEDLKSLFPKLQSRTQDFIKCDTKYQLYTCEAKNKSCKDDDEDDKDDDEDDKNSECWKTPKPSKDGKVPLKDFKYFAQSQYSVLYEMKQQQSLPMSNGNDDSSQTQCYYDVYYYVYYCPSWTPGPLYRPGLTEWKKYLMDDAASNSSSNTCGYDSSSSAEQFKQYNETLSSEESLKISKGGVIFALASDMEAKGIGPSFYRPGLTTREEEASEADKEKEKKDKDKDEENDNGFCDSCALEPYHDEMEAVINELNSFVDAVKDLNKQSSENLASTWESWIKWFYDEGKIIKDEETCKETPEENTDDYYDTLQVLVEGEDLDCDGYTGKKNVTLRDCSQDDHPAITDSDGNEITVDELQGLKAWNEELNRKKSSYISKLPACELSCTDTNGDGLPEYCYYANSPCYDSANKIISLDGDQEDEFEEAIDALEALIDKIGEGKDPPKGSIRYEMKEYDTDMNNLYKSSVINFGGKNPVTYRWRDSACPVSLTDSEDWDNDCDTTETGFCHSIKVQTSDFKAPWVKKKTSGGFLSKKTCLILTDYCYDPDKKHILSHKGKYACKNSYNPVSVTITKKDITKQDMGILGKFTRQDETDTCESLTEEERDAQAAEDKQVRDNDLERVTIEKKSRAYFSYYKLGLEDTK